MKNSRIILAIMTICLFVSVTPAYALEFVSNPLSDIKVQDGKLAWQISNAYELMVTSDQVCFLSTRLEYGEIALLIALADTSGSQPQDIFNMRVNKEMGWTKIADNLGVKLGDVLPKVGDVLHQSKMDKEFQALQTKIDQEKTSGEKAITAPEKQRVSMEEPKRKTGHSLNPKLPPIGSGSN